jgi:toxin ParE1/3/4
MNIVWSPEAIEDMVSLRAYISEEDPAAARQVVFRITQSIEQLLPDNPQIGRAGRVPGTRELVIPSTPYIRPLSVPADHLADFACLPRGTALA